MPNILVDVISTIKRRTLKFSMMNAQPFRRSAASIKHTLSELGVIPKKRRGQNFLLDAELAQRIADFANISSAERVIEIGPGLGVLTKRLLSRTNQLRLVEIEPEFCELLKKLFPQLSSQDIVCADIRTINLRELGGGSEKWVVVGNIPYAITTDMLLWVLENRDFISRASLLVQHEFAKRLVAKPGNKDYSSLTVLLALSTEARLGEVIGGDNFYPKAKVDSCLVELKILEKPRVPLSNPGLFTKLVRASFSMRRKTLLNCLTHGDFLGEKEETKQFLVSHGIDPTRRGETLSLEEFAALAEGLRK